MKKFFKFFLIALILTSFVLAGFSAFATSSQGEKEKLEKQLEDLLTEITSKQRELVQIQAKGEQYQHQVNTIKNQINNLNAQIRNTQNTIKSLTSNIREKESSIVVTSLKIDDLKIKLSNNLKTIYEEDQKTAIEIILSEKNIGEFFNDSFSLERLSFENRVLLGQITELKINLEGEKMSLDERKIEAERIAKIQVSQAQEAEQIKKSQESLLNQTKAQEAEQARKVAELEKQAAEIRARLFELAGTPTSQAPTFGEAYEIAKWVEGITGVRPAFLLAVLHQESSIGKNVGRCYLSDTTSGATNNPSTGQTFQQGIHPTRDLPNFLIIVKELGLDPLNTPVSCQIPSVGGYGGAMGPAQFIPSTWMSYRDRLAGILGRPANPWSTRDSFLASGLYLSDYGAGAKTRDAEWCAAQGYFTGRKCNPNNAFYGNNVLAIADRFQADINILSR